MPDTKLCPLWKTKVVARYEKAWDKVQATYIDTLTPAEWKEESLPCLGDKCAWYHETLGQCVLANLIDLGWWVVNGGKSYMRCQECLYYHPIWKAIIPGARILDYWQCLHPYGRNQKGEQCEFFKERRWGK